MLESSFYPCTDSATAHNTRERVLQDVKTDRKKHVDIIEKLMSKMFFAIGSSEWSCKLFLEVKAEDDLQDCREILNEIFDEYILSTKRFKNQ